MTLALEFKNTTSDYTGTGAGLAGRLTSAQVDNNNWLIKQAVEALQASSGKTISGITAVGDQMTITYTDATTDVITIPTATWTWRGEWDAGVSYAANDLFSETGTIYLVLLAHTSASSFDAGETSTAGDLYQQILDFPAVPGKTVTEATYTPVLADANSYIRCTNAGGCTVTFDSSVAFPDWSEIHFRDETNGGVTFDIDSDGSINPQYNCEQVTAGPGSTATLKKVGSTSAWDLMGLLAASSA